MKVSILNKQPGKVFKTKHWTVGLLQPAPKPIKEIVLHVGCWTAAALYGGRPNTHSSNEHKPVKNKSLKSNCLLKCWNILPYTTVKTWCASQLWPPEADWNGEWAAVSAIFIITEWSWHQSQSPDPGGEKKENPTAVFSPTSPTSQQRVKTRTPTSTPNSLTHNTAATAMKA